MRVRTTLTMLGIAIASGSLVCMVAFVLGLRQQVEAPIQKLGLLNNIEVRPKAASSSEPNPASNEDNSTDEEVAAEPSGAATETARAETAVLDDAMLARFEAIEGVEYAYPDFRLSEIQLTYESKTETSYAIGLPREVALTGMYSDLLVAGDFFALGDEAEAILGEETAKKLGFATAEAAIGQTIQIKAAGLVTSAESTSQFSLRTQQLPVRVVGVYRPPGFATRIGADSILLPVDLMRDLPGTLIERSLRRLRSGVAEGVDGFPEVVVRVRNPLDVRKVEKAIQALGFETDAVLNRIEDARRFFVFMQLLLASVGTVALVVAGFGILNTLLMSVMERYQEIGVYKAIGASNGDLRVIFLSEAALLGLMGGLTGLVLARVVSWILQIGIDIYATREGVAGPLTMFQFPPWLLSGAVAYALLVSLISGWYPASRAARVDPIQALRR